MRTSIFLLVVMGVGFLLTLYFDRMRERYGRRHPRRDNPVLSWLTGRDRDGNGKGNGGGDEDGNGGGQKGNGGQGPKRG